MTHTLLLFWSKFFGESISKTLPPGLSVQAPITYLDMRHENTSLQMFPYQDLIEIHDCLKTVGNGNYCATGAPEQKGRQHSGA